MLLTLALTESLLFHLLTPLKVFILLIESLVLDCSFVFFKVIASVMARYDLTEQLSLQLNIDNLSNEKYINGIYFGQIYFGEPLTIKGKLAYQF